MSHLPPGTPMQPPSQPVPVGRPAPLPVQPLAYSMPLPAGRPGLLTAIGVMSIVIASLSLIASLGTGAQAIGFYFMTQMTAKGTPATVTTSSGPVATTAPPSPTAAGPATTASDGSDGSANPRATDQSDATATPGAVAPATVPSIQPTAQPTAAGPSLTPSEIQGAIQRAQSATGNKLTPAQVAALRRVLQDPTQALVTPGTAWSPVQMATIQGDGTAFIQFSGGYVSINPQGQVVSQFTNTGFVGPAFQIPTAPLVLVGCDAVVSLGLAILLLVAGILVFRQSNAARRLHKVYAWLKIPVAIAGATGFGWMYGAMMSAFPGGGGGGASAVFAAYAVGLAVLGVAYPIGLLIALRARSVRAYYGSVTGGG